MACTISISPNPACKGQAATITITDPAKAGQTDVEVTISDAGEDERIETVDFDANGKATIVFDVPNDWDSVTVDLDGCPTESVLTTTC